MIQLLLLLSVSTIACILCNKITAKIGVPMLLAFLCVGMLCGEDGILGISFNDYQLTENVCTAALILIIFYGGFGTKWSAAKPVAVRAILLSTVGVFLTAATVGIFCYFVLHVGLLESLLIGSVISSTDAASVFSILRAKKLNLKYGTASLLEVESGSNDPIAYLMVTVVVTIGTRSEERNRCFCRYGAISGICTDCIRCWHWHFSGIGSALFSETFSV